MHRNVLAALFCWSALGAVAEPATGQTSRLSVLVDQVAGANVYVRAGTDAGIATADTLFVYDASGQRYLGALLVLSATRTRAVLTFTDDPFLLTRGTTVLLTFEAVAAETDAAGTAQPPARADRSARTSGYPPQVRGRLSLQFNAVETTSRWLSTEENVVAQRFGTPVLGLRMAVSHLPGDLELTTNVRGSYRYSSRNVVNPAQSVRVYELAAAKSFDRVPLQFRMGRFYNPVETYSGYWDGVLLHYGDRGLGFGVAVGFEPERTNEAFSTASPKYGAFVDFNHVAGSVGYYTDLSFHRLRPRDGLGDRTTLGWSQSLTLGRTRLSSDLQVDRDGGSDSWTLTRLHASGSVPIVGRLSLHARYTRDEPSLALGIIGLPSFRRQQGNAGIAYWARGGSFRADVTANRVEGRDLSYTFSSSFSVIDTPLFGLGFQGAGSYWSDQGARAVNLVGGIDRRFGSLRMHGSYQMYRTEGLTDTLLTHNVDVGVVMPLAQRLYSTIQVRFERGANRTANVLFVNLWKSF